MIAFAVTAPFAIGTAVSVRLPIRPTVGNVTLVSLAVLAATVVAVAATVFIGLLAAVAIVAWLLLARR